MYCNMSIGDIINSIMLLFTFIGLIFTIIELKQNKKINRASLIKELYLELYNDEDMMEIFYDIEYDINPNDENYDLELHNSDYGRKVDKLISFFEVVCNMYYRKVITRKDIEIFSYEMTRVFCNKKNTKIF